MIETLQQTEFGRYLLTFLVSMLPIVELRGAIPIGVGAGLGTLPAMITAVIGNMVPVPFIIMFIRHIFAWLRVKSARLERLVSRLESRAEGKWEKVHRYQLLGLMILVAIPLPGTGAWTGALVAALMDIRLKNAVPAIFLGVVIAGILVTGITYGFKAVIY
jgi:uncharacterized membrane protein